MAFKTRWVCEYCGNVIFASECSNEDECSCYAEPDIYIYEKMKEDRVV